MNNAQRCLSSFHLSKHLTGNQRLWNAREEGQREHLKRGDRIRRRVGKREMINEGESGAYRNGGVKEYVAANYVRVLAKLDVLDAKNENETAEGDFEDENGSGSKMNIYGHVATIDLSDANNKSEFLDEKFIRCLHEPVLIQNAFEKSRQGSASSWTLRKLLEAHEKEEKRTGGLFQTTVRVRMEDGVSSGNNGRRNAKAFVYAEQSHEAIRNRKFQPPSLTQQMPFANGLSRVLEYSGDGAYIQSELPSNLKDEMEHDYSRVFTSFENSEEFVESQPLRLWLSKRGSVSPLHFDASISTLTQLKGEKTFLLFAPFSGLSQCYLYPDWHPLRRRSQLSIDDERIRNGLRAYEATLSEGDVLIFPPRWLHHVESSNKTNYSVSITRRYIYNASSGVNTDTSYALRFAKWAKTRDKGTKALSRLYSSGMVNPDFPSRFNLAVIDLDEDGKCPKLCETKTFERNVQEKWKVCVKALSDRIVARTKNISSICVRGSIARGAAVDFESDCDLIVVFENERPNEQELQDLRSELEDVRAQEFPFAKKIDVRFEKNRDELNAEQLFTLATSSLCVSGEDIPKSSSRMAPVRTSNLTLLEDVDSAIENGSEKAMSWACKRCLRAAFESQKRTRFTREISRCCEIVCEEDYPKKKYEVGDLETALVIAVKGPKMVFGDAYWLEMSTALLKRLSNCILSAKI